MNIESGLSGLRACIDFIGSVISLVQVIDEFRSLDIFFLSVNQTYFIWGPFEGEQGVAGSQPLNHHPYHTSLTK